MSTCDLFECEKTHHAKGLCSRHYMLNRRHGDPRISKYRQRGMDLGDLVNHELFRADRQGECLVGKPYKDEWGYCSVGFEGKIHHLHRLVLEWATGKPLAADELALHKCHNPGCIRPGHLYIGDNIQKGQDMIEAEGWGKRRDPDSTNPVHLSPRYARAIRRLYHEAVGRYTHIKLAELFGVSRQQIGRIVNDKNWKAA